MGSWFLWIYYGKIKNLYWIPQKTESITEATKLNWDNYHLVNEKF